MRPIEAAGDSGQWPLRHQWRITSTAESRILGVQRTMHSRSFRAFWNKLSPKIAKPFRHVYSTTCLPRILWA
jgi:hypothetical protein